MAQAPTSSGPGRPSRRRGRPTSLPFFLSLFRTVNHQLDAVYGIIIMFPAVVVELLVASPANLRSIDVCLWFCSTFALRRKTASSQKRHSQTITTLVTMNQLIN